MTLLKDGRYYVECDQWFTNMVMGSLESSSLMLCLELLQLVQKLVSYK